MAGAQPVARASLPNLWCGVLTGLPGMQQRRASRGAGRGCVICMGTLGTYMVGPAASQL